MKKLLYLLLLTSLAIKPDYASTTTTKRNKKNKKKLARRTKKISKSNARNSGGGATRSNAIGPVSQIKTTTSNQKPTDPENLLTSFDDSLFEQEQFGSMTKEELDKKEKIKKHKAKKNFIKDNQKKIEDEIKKEHPNITIDDLKKKTDDLLSSQFEDSYTIEQVEIKEANKPKAKTKEEIEEAIKSSNNKKTIKEKEKELKKLKNQEEANQKKAKTQNAENENNHKSKNEKLSQKLQQEKHKFYILQKNNIKPEIKNGRLIYSYTKEATNNTSEHSSGKKTTIIDAGTLYWKFTTSLFDLISYNETSNQQKISNIEKIFILQKEEKNQDTNEPMAYHFIDYMRKKNIDITKKSILYIIFSDILASINQYHKKINTSSEIKKIEKESKINNEKINNQIKELKTKETTGENNDQLKKLQGEISTLEKESNINIEKIKEQHATTCINNIQENIIKPIKDKYANIEYTLFLKSIIHTDDRSQFSDLTEQSKEAKNNINETLENTISENMDLENTISENMDNESKKKKKKQAKGEKRKQKGKHKH